MTKAGLRGLSFAEQTAMLEPPGAAGPVQRKGGGQETANVHQAAQAGVAGSGAQLPYFDRIQASFGSHDVSNVQAYSGGAAAQASEAMGASAYATGDKVAFGRTPDLHTAAHEAAHTVQQRQGVQLKGGVGEAGDAYERQADAAADAVVQGKSAEPILGASGAQDGGALAVQHQKKKTSKKPAAAKPEAEARFEQLDLGSGSMKDICQGFVADVTNAANLTVMNQAAALDEFREFMTTASMADTQVDVLGTAVSAAFDLLSDAVLGRFKGLAQTLAASVMGFGESAAADTAPEPKKKDGPGGDTGPAAPGAGEAVPGGDKGGAAPGAKPKGPGGKPTSGAPGAAAFGSGGIPMTSSPKPAAASEEEESSKPESGGGASAIMAAGGKVYGALKGIFDVVQKKLDDAAKAKKAVDLRDFIREMRSALTDGYAASLGALGSTLVESLDSAALDLGAGMGDWKWKTGQRMAFNQQAAFLQALRSEGQGAVGAVPSSADYLGSILNRWTSDRRSGGGTIEITATVTGTQVVQWSFTGATFKGARQGQINDMFSNVMAATGRKVTELGLPVYVSWEGPSFSNNSVKNYRVRYEGPQSVSADPGGLSIGARNQWEMFPSGRLEALRKLG